ncbi:MAG: SUMF1/EgtB/PvdO family nonheme iron enzyme [Planctomycetota bacterium]|nr:SUMF1/EgtB/PvdO family nonheme iron enzyme [Planctomycetota bacterium]
MRYNLVYDSNRNLFGNPAGYGAVAYAYQIGKFEVTAGQYTTFLNAVAATDPYGLFFSGMANPTGYQGCNIQRSGSPGTYIYTVPSDWANRPVNCVSWGCAARFCNWVANGQPTGACDASTTEDGSYDLSGTHAGFQYGPQPNNPNSGGWSQENTALMAVTRKANAKYVIPTEDEWYKAAYYKGGGTNAGYWDYPTRSNTAPGGDMNDASGNNANNHTQNGPYPIDGISYHTVVGEFQNSAGPYGTFDQGGNVLEWNSAVVGDARSRGRGSRGGASNDSAISDSAAERYAYAPFYEQSNFGFRIVQIPEPATLSLLALGGLAVLRRRYCVHSARR